MVSANVYLAAASPDLIVARIVAGTAPALKSSCCLNPRGRQ